MHSSCRTSARPQSLKVLCGPMCVLYSAVWLVGWPLSSEAARLRCGTDLLSDLIFVCGDRGIYLGRGTWSGYGARPRGKGIVDQCCRPAGCELQHLEMYCDKPKSQEQTTTAYPTTTTASPTTTTASPTTTTASPTTTTASPTTNTASPTTAQQHMTQQFAAVFQRRLMEQLGAPGSQQRDSYRKKTQLSPRRKSKTSSSRRKMNRQNMTSRPTSAASSTRETTTRFES